MFENKWHILNNAWNKEYFSWESLAQTFQNSSTQPQAELLIAHLISYIVIFHTTKASHYHLFNTNGLESWMIQVSRHTKPLFRISWQHLVTW
jgi:hypothetical protein